MNQKFYQKYLRQVSAHLACDRKHKKILLEGFQNELEERLDGASCNCYEDLVQILGSPQQVAEELIDGVPFSERCKTASKRKWIMLGIILLLVIVVTVLVAKTIEAARIQAGYTEVTLTIYE